jgi:hypothetical protein
MTQSFRQVASVISATTLCSYNLFSANENYKIVHCEWYKEGEIADCSRRFTRLHHLLAGLKMFFAKAGIRMETDGI